MRKVCVCVCVCVCVVYIAIMESSREYHAKQGMSRQRQISYGITYMWNLKNNTN